MNFEEMLRLIDKVSDSSLSSFEYETEELKLSIQCGEKAVLTAAPMVSETELRENVSGKKEEPPPTADCPYLPALASVPVKETIFTTR